MVETGAALYTSCWRWLALTAETGILYEKTLFEDQGYDLASEQA